MSVIEIVILVLAIIMSLVGVLGTILPILPGMLLCAIPMVTLYFLYPGIQVSQVNKCNVNT